MAGPSWKEGDVITTLEGGQLKRNALDRVRALNPDLSEVEVAIKVERSTGPGVFSIAASAPEPKYARIYLGALVDEAAAYAEELAVESADKSATAIKSLERASAALEEIHDWRADIVKGGAIGGFAGLFIAMIVGFSVRLGTGAKDE